VAAGSLDPRALKRAVKVHPRRRDIAAPFRTFVHSRLSSPREGKLEDSRVARVNFVCAMHVIGCVIKVEREREMSLRVALIN